MSDSHNTNESNFLKNLFLKKHIAWSNSTDEWWTQLDDKVSDKLHMCTALADTLFLQQESIYTEAATISGGKKKEEPGWTKSSNQFVHSTYWTKNSAFGSN